MFYRTDPENSIPAPNHKWYFLQKLPSGPSLCSSSLEALALLHNLSSTRRACPLPSSCRLKERGLEGCSQTAQQLHTIVCLFSLNQGFI